MKSLYIEIPPIDLSAVTTFSRKAQRYLYKSFIATAQNIHDRIHVTTRAKLTVGTCSVLGGLLAVIFRGLVTNVVEHRDYYALFLLAFAPLNFFYFSYAANAIVSNVYMMFSSMTMLSINSSYYSAVKTYLPSGTTPSSHTIIPLLSPTPTATPPTTKYRRSASSSSKSSAISFPAPIKSGVGTFANTMYEFSRSIPNTLPSVKHLPFVLIHIPVYKESLWDVIVPSCQSVFRAMEEYIAHGGSCKLMISDDGLMCISEKERNERVSYYDANNISYVGRPVENRPGRFKKASNLNYTYRLCEKIRQEGGVFLYDTVANGDLTIPEDTIILLLDADTRVPTTCIIDTIPEFVATPELPYTQHFTMPFPILKEQAHDYWLGMISHFTENIYRVGIGFSTALGGCCPLVGHNAFIRYKMLKEEGFWSENSVCEDFDLFLRLACKGRYGRYVIYTGPEFQEGVSLTFADEVAKFRKFTYGAFEMCLHPFREWFHKGPISTSMLHFLKSPINWHSKCNVVFYLSTYFAMANAFYFAVIDGFTGLFYPGFYDRYMARGFDIMFGCVAIFAGLTTISQIVFNVRIMHKPNIWNEIKWIPFFTLFFSGLMFHMTEVGFRYMFMMPITWGATSKDPLQTISLAQSLKTTVRHFWLMYSVFLPILCSYIYTYYRTGQSMYRSWSLFHYLVSHLLAPIVFDPAVIDLFRQKQKP